MKIQFTFSMWLNSKALKCIILGAIYMHWYVHNTGIKMACIKIHGLMQIRKLYGVL